MTPEVFKAQIVRLKTEWPNAYGEARCLALWDVYQEVSDEIFRNAVTSLLLDHRGGAPVRADIERAVESARWRWKQRQWESTELKILQAPNAGMPVDEVKRRQLVADLFKKLDGSGKVEVEMPDTDARRDELMQQAKSLSARDLAAGEGRDG